MYVSYSQNFEDVMLHRVFAGKGNGFYIDVGAWHPDHDSVTKHFYDAGWSGINIEPSKYYFEMLRRRRPRDVNLNVALGREVGELEFFEVRGSAMSSLKPEAMARGEHHGFDARRYVVPVDTLQSICDTRCQGREISFLKIDVEGLEKDVIDSLDWTVHRPVIVLVEAVHPDTRLPDWHAWEPKLLESGYCFVWFDGLNRYYLRNESGEYAKHFEVPPNLFDGFVLCSNHSLTMRLGMKLRMFIREHFPDGMQRLMVAMYRTCRRIFVAARS